MSGQSIGEAGAQTVSNDAVIDLMREYSMQKRRCLEENGVLRNILKRGKKDGINVKALITTCEATKLEPDIVIRDLSDTVRYMALRKIPMTMQDWETRLNRFLAATDREVLGDAGKVTAEIARARRERVRKIPHRAGQALRERLRSRRGRDQATG